MKRLVNGVCLLALVGAIVTACEKEEIVLPVHYGTEIGAKDVNELLIETIRQEASVKPKSIPNPANSNNIYDTFGLYHKNMILNISSSEDSIPSNSISEYQTKYESYLVNNPFQDTFPVINFPFDSLFVALTELITEFAVEEHVNEAIIGLLAVENNIYNTNLLTVSQKAYLLSFSSSLKYSRYTIATFGLTIDGVTIGPGSQLLKTSSAASFDAAFSKGVHSVYNNFVDTDNPGNMLAAWAGFGVTIVAGISNGFYRGFKDC